MVDGLCRNNRGKHFFSTPFGVCFFTGVNTVKKTAVDFTAVFI